MRYLKIILLMGTLSIAFASFPKGTTVIGGWGTYSNGTIDSENFCDDCSYLELNPNISYFLRPNLSLDLYLNLKIWDGEDKENEEDEVDEEDEGGSGNSTEDGHANSHN